MCSQAISFACSKFRSEIPPPMVTCHLLLVFHFFHFLGRPRLSFSSLSMPLRFTTSNALPFRFFLLSYHLHSPRFPHSKSDQSHICAPSIRLLTSSLVKPRVSFYICSFPHPIYARQTFSRRSFIFPCGLLSLSLSIISLHHPPLISFLRTFL